MRKVLCLLFLAPGLLLARNSWSQDAQEPARLVNPAVSGRWVVTADFYGTPINFSLELNQQEDKLTGSFGEDKLEGSFNGNAVHFLAKDEPGGSEECKATVQGGSMSGTIVFTDADDPTHPATR